MEPETPPEVPENASGLTRLRMGIRALKVLEKEPGHAFYGPLLNFCLDAETYAEIARAWREHDDQRRLLDERPTLQGRELDLEALARLPEGTLGHEFVRYFHDNGIEPFVSAYPVRNDVEYLAKRYRETHDLAHIITGHGTDELGEMELQAFVLGNLGLRQTLLILAVSVPRHWPLVGVRGFGGYLRRLVRAYHRGKRSRELLGVSYETLWERPVAALAEELCAPGPAGPSPAPA